jgi:hypothetical protein
MGKYNEIVIAGYDKELGWLKQLDPKVVKTVYRKGDVLPLSSGEIKLEVNLGRCVHTFFNHIYLNYGKESDYTFFVQDYPFDHWGNLIDIINGDTNNISKSASLTIGGYHGFHNNTLGTAWNMSESTQFDSGNVLSCLSNGMPQDHNPLINVDKYWDLIFDDKKPTTYEFIPGGHFCIHKEHIKLRTRKLYKQICELLIEDENAPWMIERLECYIFNPKYKTKL